MSDDRQINFILRELTFSIEHIVRCFYDDIHFRITDMEFAQGCRQ